MCQVSPDAVETVGVLLQTGLVRDAVPGLEETVLEDVREAALGVGVEGVDGAAVGDALHLDLWVDGVKLVSQHVTVALRTKPSSRGSSENNLLSLSDPGVLYQVRYDGLHDVFPIEIPVVGLSAGIPGARVDITAAVRDVGWREDVSLQTIILPPSSPLAYHS